MYATAGDLLSYAYALENQTVLTEASQHMMVDGAFHVTKNLYYGFGWIVRKAGRLTCIHHGGGTNGYESEFIIYPQQRTVIIVLSNFGFADPEDIWTNIAAQLFGKR